VLIAFIPLFVPCAGDEAAIRQAKSMLPRLRACAVLQDAEGIYSYLVRQPDQAVPLLHLCRTARQYFGPAAELMLTYHGDPEQGNRHLTLYVRLDIYTEVIIDHIEAFRQQPDIQSCPVHITTDFAPPRYRRLARSEARSAAS
jgi:hypothetical protein